MGNHTHDKVAERLNIIFSRFDILGKVFFITTDGAGENVAGINRFGDNYASINRLRDACDLAMFDVDPFDTETQANENVTENESDDESDGPDLVLCDVGDLGTTSRNQNKNFIVVNLFPVQAPSDLGNCDDDPPFPSLPNMNRVSCSSHLLDKVGKNDVDKAKENPTQLVFDQKESKESRIKAEIFFRLTGRKLIGPHRIRWLKTYDAVSELFRFFLTLSISYLYI